MMGRREAIRAGVLMAVGASVTGHAQQTNLPTTGQSTPPVLETQIRVHDPSTVVACDKMYWVFCTGRGIRSYFSTDFVHWQKGPPVFATPPAWTQTAVPGFKDYFWAPDIIQVNGVYYLYYAVSTFKSQISAIGLATNPTLDPAHPDYRWTDFGPVIQSAEGNEFNAIDPSLLRDDHDHLWMAFGSFWKGIMLVELDLATGKRLDADAPPKPLAYNESIEASYLYHHGDYFYLFVNWGLCCRGVNSTYNIRVGRSASISGPYRDREGKAMLDGGGTLFLGDHENRIGPGQTGIATIQGEEWFTYHYYDATQNGKSFLGQQRLTWGADGWPMLQTGSQT